MEGLYIFLIFVIVICLAAYFFSDEISVEGLDTKTDEDPAIEVEFGEDGEDVSVDIDFSEFDLEEVKGIGPKTKEKLLDVFGDIKSIYEAADDQLLEYLSETKLQRLRSLFEDKKKN